MNAIDVIKTELACVQRDCCRVENQCAKCDLVLPVEEIISAYKKCISVLLEHEKLEKENAELKSKVGLSIECEKAQKDGELCLGYGGDEDEPCERCKNCIKCECGYYQLGETKKDEYLTKAKELLNEFMRISKASDEDFEHDYSELIGETEQFIKDSEVEKCQSQKKH